jgi:hypothetical protein
MIAQRNVTPIGRPDHDLVTAVAQLDGDVRDVLLDAADTRQEGARDEGDPGHAHLLRGSVRCAPTSLCHEEAGCRT